MRLSSKQGEIICSAQLRANAPVSQIRRLTGYRDHTIRYALNSALDDKLLRPACFVNLCLLGFTQYEIYFSVSAETKKYSRERVLDAIRSCDRISWAGELGGEYHFGLNLCVRGIQEVNEFLEQLSVSLGLLYLEKAFAARIALSFYGNKYLCSRALPLGKLSYRATDQQLGVDETDHRILRALVLSGGVSRRELARSLNIPFSTLESRVRKLEQQKLIVVYYYQVNSSLLGIQSFLLLLSVKGFNAERKKKLYKFCQEHPNIIVLIEAVGSWDFELVVEVAEGRHVIQLVQDLQAQFSAFLHGIKVLPSFDYFKVREYPFDTFPGAR